MSGQHPSRQLREGMTPASRQRADQLADTLRAQMDPLAAVTTKPGKLTKADKEAANRQARNVGLAASLSSLRAFQSDPQRDRDGPQFKPTQRGVYRVRYVPCGNPYDLYGRW